MRGKKHSDEIRAQVMAALLAGQGVSEVAAKYQIDPSVVSRWRKQLPATQLQEVATKKATSIGELLTEYLEECLATLTVQVRHFRNVAWLQDQPADSLAVLHGVLTDKAIRILSAAEPVPDGNPVDPAAGAAESGLSQPGG